MSHSHVLESGGALMKSSGYRFTAKTRFKVATDIVTKKILTAFEKTVPL